GVWIMRLGGAFTGRRRDETSAGVGSQIPFASLTRAHSDHGGMAMSASRRSGPPLAGWPKGTTAAPPSGPSYVDVAVVGAGFAGLTAARKLGRGGREAVGLGGRGRGGGRGKGGRVAGPTVGGRRGPPRFAHAALPAGPVT